MTTEAFFFLTPGMAEERRVLEHTGAKTQLIWVPDGQTAARVAGELASAGVALIELYRGFDLTTAAEVIAAVDGRAPVGVALHEPSPVVQGPVSRSVTIYADSNADPADRIVLQHAPESWTTIVGAPDAAAAAAVATELAEAGAELVEICGGTPLTTADQVRRALDGRAAVSLVTWPFESIDGAAAFKAAYEEKLS